MVTAGAPALRVVPSISIAVGLAVRVWPPMVKMCVEPPPEAPVVGGGVGIGMIELPILRPPGP